MTQMLEAPPPEAERQTEEEQGLSFFEKLFILPLVWSKTGLPELKRHRTKTHNPPSRGIDGNFNYGADGYTWAWFEVPTIRAWDYLGSKRQGIEQKRLENALESLPGGRYHLCVESVPINLDAADKAWRRLLVSKASPRIQGNHATYRTYMRRWIEQRGFKERRVYLGYRLQEKRTFAQLVVSRVRLLEGVDPAVAHGDPAVRFRSQTENLLRKFAAHGISLRPLEQRELLQLIRRSIFRGHESPDGVNFDHDKPIHSETELARLGASLARDKDDHLKILHQGRKSFVTYLAVAKLDEPVVDIGWLFASDNRGSPVEVSARIHVKPSERVLAEANHTIQVLKKTRKQVAKGNRQGGSDEDIIRITNQITTAQRQKARAAKHKHSVITHAMMIVSGSTLEELETKRTHVIETSSRVRHTALEVDPGRQPEMRRTSYPGAKPVYGSYPLALFADGFASGMPHASSVFGNGGDLHGIVLGQDAYPFHYSHSKTISKEVDASTGQVFVGPPGEGKTDAMAERAVADARNGFAVIFDEGKGDTGILKGKEIPLVETAHLNLADFPGLLNPLWMSDDPKERQDLTLQTLLRFIRGERERGWRGLLDEVIGDEIKEHPEDASLENIIVNRLLKAPETDPESKDKRALGRAMTSMLRTKHSEVIFGDTHSWRKVAKDYLKAGQITFVLYDELTIPTEARPEDQYSDQEQLGVVIRDLTNLLYVRVAANPHVPFSIYKDEIHLDAMLKGSSFIDRMARIGRAKRTLISLGSQSLDDIPGNFLEYCSTYNIFTLSEEAAPKAIPILGLAVDSDEHRQTLIDLISGKAGRKKYEVLVKIHTGEVAMVAFKQVQLGGQFASNYEMIEAMHQAETSHNGTPSGDTQLSTTER